MARKCELEMERAEFPERNSARVEKRDQPLAAMSASTAAMVRTGTPVPPFEV